MSIRTNANRKDHLREHGGALTLVSEPSGPEVDDHLRFWTAHPSKPTLVDLNIFETGQQSIHAKGKLWNGPFSGRPALIAEMAPAIYDHLVSLAEKSVVQFKNALRTWWRLFDTLEAEMPDAPAITSASQLTELHRQRALDQGMDRLVFSNFLLLVNKTRTGLGLKPLYWQRPEHRSRTRHLPPQWQTDLVRHELKHRWFAIVDRWELAANLLQKGAPLVSPEHESAQYAEQSRLHRIYQRLESVIASSGFARPRTAALYGEQSKDGFYKQYTLMESLRGRYPDGDDIRAALHLCLATTGWNPAVFLALNVDEPFIEPHPKDSTRYILRGVKDRAGGAEQISEGLFKTRGSAGFVLQTLITQTAPLREELRRELRMCREQLYSSGPLTPEKHKDLDERIAALERGIRSPWLFTSHVGNGIHWLSDDSFGGKDFLSEVIASINRRQPADRQLSPLKASDLRDAYAARVYHASGGSILAVMKALNHRRLSSTRDYLDNTLLREEHRQLYGTFSSALWEEIRVHRRVDPTVLAMWSRHGKVNPEHRVRLKTYREILRSRIGVGCKDPLHPPKHIAPDFQHDGKALCSVQRCLLCLEHAVIFPDSLPGLCKRFAELRYLQTNMSVTAFAQSSFGEELTNTELALLGFDQSAVARHVGIWDGRIASGTHRVVEFDGSGALL
jgi:hypothetical protein